MQRLLPLPPKLEPPAGLSFPTSEQKDDIIVR